MMPRLQRQSFFLKELALEKKQTGNRKISPISFERNSLLLFLFKVDPKTGVLDFADGKEWCVLKLGVPGVVKKIEVDTNHFKGNFPDSIGSMTSVLEQQF